MINFLGQPIENQEIIDFLKKQVHLKEVCQKLLHQKIINKAIKDYNIEITAEEIQTEGDNIRRKRNLEQASDTFAWLEEELISVEDWEAGIYDELAANKLANYLFSGKVEDFFNQNKHQFEQVLLYEIIIPYERLAWEVFYQIEEEEMSFYQAAHLYDIDLDRRIQCGYVGKVHRQELKSSIAALVFQATPGNVLTPIKSDEGYHIFLVEEFIPAELTDEVYQTLLKRMFQDWLAKELDYMLFNKTENYETNN